MPITTSIPSNKCITVDEFNDLFENFAGDYDYSDKWGNTLNDFGLVTTPPTNFQTNFCIANVSASQIMSITKFVAYQYINGKLCYTLGFQRGSWYTINCCCIMGQLRFNYPITFMTLLVDEYSATDAYINFRHMAIYHKTLGWFCQLGGSPMPLYIPCNNFFEAFGMAMENAEK